MAGSSTLNDPKINATVLLQLDPTDSVGCQKLFFGMREVGSHFRQGSVGKDHVGRYVGFVRQTLAFGTQQIKKLWVAITGRADGRRFLDSLGVLPIVQIPPKLLLPSQNLPGLRGKLHAAKVGILLR
jgi:hypothetical protein